MENNFVYNYVPCRIIFDGTDVELPLDTKQKIKKNWDYIHETGNRFYNNELFTIDSIEFKDCELLLNVKKTQYDHYLYSMSKRFIGENICHSLASNILILTADNYYVLAIMSTKTALPNKIKFIGGSLSETDLEGNTLNLLKCIKRETYEEIGLQFEDSSNIIPRYYIIKPGFSLFNTLFVVKTEMSRENIRNLFDSYKDQLKNDELELNNVLFVKNNKEEINRFLEVYRLNMVEYMEELFYILMGELNAKNIENIAGFQIK